MPYVLTYGPTHAPVRRYAGHTIEGGIVGDIIIFDSFEEAVRHKDGLREPELYDVADADNVIGWGVKEALTKWRKENGN